MASPNGQEEEGEKKKKKHNFFFASTQIYFALAPRQQVDSIRRRAGRLHHLCCDSQRATGCLCRQQHQQRRQQQLQLHPPSSSYAWAHSLQATVAHGFSFKEQPQKETLTPDPPQPPQHTPPRLRFFSHPKTDRASPETLRDKKLAGILHSNTENTGNFYIQNTVCFPPDINLPLQTCARLTK